jgi:hypothetical protein
MKRFLLVLAFLAFVTPAFAQNAPAPELVYYPNYLAPPCAGIFTDVPCPGQYANWAEQMFNEGLSVGTGNNTFSPQLPIPREQAAVWVLRAEHSVLERFAVGHVTCPAGDSPAPLWAKCTSTKIDPRINENSVVMLTYRTRGSDDQIPARVVNIYNGSFTFEIQTGQHADYLAYVAEEFVPTPTPATQSRGSN